MNKKLKKIGVVFACGVATATIGYGLLSEWGCQKLLRRSKKAYDPQKSLQYYEHVDDVIVAQQWLNECQKEHLLIHSVDDTELHGVKITSHPSSNKWAILVHGYRSDHRSMALSAHVLAQKGFNCLMIDLRAHGQSGGLYTTLGWTDRLDLLCWINLLCAMHPKSSIVLCGVSMGATTVLNVTGEKLPEQVKCCVSDSAFSEVKRASEHMSSVAHLGALWPAMRWISELHLKYRLNIAKTTKQLEKSKTPTLFIHGEQDQIVPFSMVFENYLACRAKKELFTVADADHLRCSNHPMYQQRVFEFIEKYV